MTTATDPNQALEALREGNARFVEGETRMASLVGAERRLMLIAEQNPRAVILGCSDSRVPPEIVFDQGLGDLFVIRVAGNIVGPSQAGSIEFAVEQLGIRLVVVLGHSGCGAVVKALEQFGSPRGESDSPNVAAILDRMRTPIEPLIQAGTPAVDLVGEAVRANVLAGVDRLRHGSTTLGKLSDEGEILILGAEYSLQTGAVEFLSLEDSGRGSHHDD